MGVWCLPWAEATADRARRLTVVMSMFALILDMVEKRR